MAQVFGVGIDELQKTLANNRYFYGLRRTDAGITLEPADELQLHEHFAWRVVKTSQSKELT